MTDRPRTGPEDPDDPGGRNGERRAGEAQREAEGEGFGRFLRPFFTDSTLWPVLIVAVAIAVTFGAAILLSAFVLRNPFAMAALLILLVVSGEAVLRDWRRRDGVGLLSGFLLALWAGSAVAAGLAVWLGLF